MNRFLLCLLMLLLVACSLNPKQGYGAFVMEQCAATDRQREKYAKTQDEHDLARAIEMQRECMEGLKRLGLVR